MSEKEMQRKYLQLQLLKQQSEAFMEEKAMIEEKISEVLTTLNALKELDRVKHGDEIWSPLGSGSFVQSDIKNHEKILINIGNGIIIKESRPRAGKILEERLTEISSVYNNLIAEIDKFNKNIQEVEQELQKFAESMQKK